MQAFITQLIPQAGLDLLDRAGISYAISPEPRRLTTDELLRHAADATGIICMAGEAITAATLAALPKLRCISNFGVGFNNIDIAACTARKIGVSNTPGVLTDATAEIAFTLLLMAARRAGEGERVARAGHWKGWGPKEFLGEGIVGKTLGIIGAGRIGAKVAHMSRGFDMQVIYAARHPNEELDRDLHARLVPLPELLRTADFISINTPLTPETHHLIGAAELGQMKPTAVLVNTSRGPVVDEAALAAALKSRTIFAAGLDVFEKEPTIHPDLLTLDNVVLLPHIGSATIATRDAMATTSAKNLIAMLNNERPPFPVNPEVWQ
jgi:glyoxylate reductase